ncbi:MAG: D-cysteine desulfhydrase family protein [Actinomycetota bacterium]
MGDAQWRGRNRVRLASLPTPLELGPTLPSGARLWIKRDDLTGLALGGNKARKLEFLCGEARANDANCLITVGAGQSNHCRMTAAAGALLGMETHVVLSGTRPARYEGNQLLSDLLGAHQHFTGAEPSQWGLLEIARDELTDELTAQGLRPYSIPIGGSTPVGALGYVAAFEEMMVQFDEQGIAPRAVVVTSSSGGTHAGLVAGRAAWRHEHGGHDLPEVIAIGVSKGVVAGLPDVAELAREAMALVGLAGEIRPDDVVVEARWLGPDYAVATEESRAARRWGAEHGALVLDQVYTAKGFAGLLGLDESGRWSGTDDVVFIHTGGYPEIFVHHGS